MISTKHGLQRRTQCAVETTYGRKIQDVTATVTAGLVVVAFPVCSTYSVTHQRSGRAVWHSVDYPDEAQDRAESLGMLANWTRPADELSASSERRRKLMGRWLTWG